MLTCTSCTGQVAHTQAHYLLSLPTLTPQPPTLTRQGYLLEENGGTFQVTDQWLAQVRPVLHGQESYREFVAQPRRYNCNLEAERQRSIRRLAMTRYVI